MKPFKAIALADLHVGSPRLDPFRFRDNIEKYVITAILAGDLSHVFIAGDFFDLLINMNSSASMIAMSVISMLKEACFLKGAKLRVLRGTFTHDRNQPRHFLVTSPEYNDCVRLYDSMAIEYDEDTEMYFLYIPDNMAVEDIYSDIETMLKDHKIDSVDVVIHHGYFKHLLPPGIPEPNGTLDYEKFKKFYKGCVLNGHVHTTSIWNNILSIGSFDRLAYGEEEAKGFYTISREGSQYKYHFTENQNATPFWTISINGFGNDTEGMINYINDAWLSKFNQFVDRGIPPHIRLLSDNSAMTESCRTYILEKCPTAIVNSGVATKQEQIIENVKLDLEELPQITPDNIEELLMGIIKPRNPSVSQTDVHGVLELLKTKG